MVLNVEDLGIFAPPLGLTPGVLASGMYRTPSLAGGFHNIQKPDFRPVLNRLRREGLEPSSLAACAPQTHAYTNSATRAKKLSYEGFAAVGAPALLGAFPTAYLF